MFSNKEVKGAQLASCIKIDFSRSVMTGPASLHPVVLLIQFKLFSLRLWKPVRDLLFVSLSLSLSLNARL